MTKESFKLFSNKYKEGGQPDMKMPKDAELVIEGKKYEVAAWENTDKNGNKYLNCVISNAYERDEHPVKQVQEQPGADKEPLADIPF